LGYAGRRQLCATVVIRIHGGEGRDSGHGRTQAVGVGGEVLRDLQGATEPYNGYRVIRRGVLVDELSRRLPGVHLIG
jgi:hypothetical protein